MTRVNIPERKVKKYEDRKQEEHTRLKEEKVKDRFLSKWLCGQLLEGLHRTSVSGLATSQAILLLNDLRKYERSFITFRTVSAP
jgi:hypothetical protein